MRGGGALGAYMCFAYIYVTGRQGTGVHASYLDLMNRVRYNPKMESWFSGKRKAITRWSNMKWKTAAALLVLPVIGMSGFAQPVPPPSDAPPPPGAAPVNASPSSDPSEPAVALAGDVVILKSGKALRGAKVVSENPIYIEVEYLPGEPPLQLPRSQVERIEYASESRGDREVASDMPYIMPGEEVSVELHRMLTAPMSQDEALEFQEADYLVVLRELAFRFNIDIDISETLEAMPTEERLFSRTLLPGTTVMDFLRDHLLEIAPEIRVILQYDKLVLQKREGVDATDEAAETMQPE